MFVLCTDAGFKMWRVRLNVCTDKVQHNLLFTRLTENPRDVGIAWTMASPQMGWPVELMGARIKGPLIEPWKGLKLKSDLQAPTLSRDLLAIEIMKDQRLDYKISHHCIAKPQGHQNYYLAINVKRPSNHP